MGRKASIKDVAARAGVSIASVSYVLNDKPGVSDDTRARVLEAVAELGYVRNAAAKALRESSSRSVGILVPDISNEFYARIVRGAEKRLHQEGYRSFVCDTDDDPQTESGYLGDLASQRVDGLVFVGGHTYGEDRHLDDFRRDNPSLPIAAVDRYIPAELDGRDGPVVTVGQSGVAVFFDLTALLLERGCRRIAYLEVSRGTFREDDPPVMYQGYAAAHAEHGLDPDPDLRLLGSHDEPSAVEAHRLVLGCLARHPELDGIVAVGDRLAYGAVRALTEAGVRVGTDVKVVSMDNSYHSRLSMPPITTVERHPQQMGEHGAEALLTLIAGEGGRHEIYLPYDIVERESTTGERQSREYDWE